MDYGSADPAGRDWPPGDWSAEAWTPRASLDQRDYCGQNEVSFFMACKFHFEAYCCW